MSTVADFPCISVIGVGLIGGSLARALKRAGIGKHLIGCSSDPDEIEEALRLGVVDTATTDPLAAVRKADLVILAVPLGAYQEVITRMAPGLSPGVVITDVGSAKGFVVDLARRYLAEHLQRFIPGHPIAGTERNGVAASFAELFDGHRVLLTPLEENSASALRQVTALWTACGAEVEHIDVDHHDDVLAATSHLPHLLAYGLVDCLLGREDNGEVFRYAAGGFADFTRIASSSPRMWTDIVFANRTALLDSVDVFEGYLRQLREWIESEDPQALQTCLERAKQARDSFVRRRQPLMDNEKGEC